MAVNLPDNQGRMFINPYSGFIRQFVLARDGNKCRHCGSTEEIQVHHRVPVSRVPELEWDAENMLTLCRPCHCKVHGRWIPPTHPRVERPTS